MNHTWYDSTDSMARIDFTRMIYTTWLVLNAVVCCTTCVTQEFCQYHNTEGVSTALLDVPRRTSSIPQSCPYLCLSDPLCTAVTFDRGRDVCRLHYENDDDSCLARVNTLGNIFWIYKRHDVCPNVSIMVWIYFVKYWIQGMNPTHFFHDDEENVF